MRKNITTNNCVSNKYGNKCFYLEYMKKIIDRQLKTIKYGGF